MVNNKFNWVKVENPDEKDRAILRDTYEIRRDILDYAMDIHERPRVEIDTESNYRLFIYDSPIEPKFKGDISVEPIGLLISDHMLFTFTRKRTKYVVPMIENILNNPSIKDPSFIFDLILETMLQVTVKFFDYINSANRERTSIQSHLTHQANRDSINQLLGLQTKTVYFLTALTSNQEMLSVMQRIFKGKLTDFQGDRLEDIIIEVNQGLSMAQVSSSVTREVADAYSNLLDSNLNSTMKFLTIFSLILSVPNIVFAFYGMNVRLPFASSPIGWIISILISIIICILIWILYHKHFS
ncbi:magnesium transporter CorA family protein [Lactobacillus sp. Sy-1]|uniref:magnesium transporter CorA family protein n=1 Tax=Lactobacillus sp. Sy-1 TaxID=2109645 RepID=UPI001C5A1772|nr:magnesium transporter CorA family protein [Lactobacillus sp. Sy-1]MBW1604881.1 magnesium transporter CorA family protein [Lactobacillus sp. Sy-1]